MKIVVLYRPNSEHARVTEAFVRDFGTEHEDLARHIELLNYDSREGNAIASLYDIFQAPAVLLLAYDGSLMKYWAGETLPLLSEVASYVQATA